MEIGTRVFWIYNANLGQVICEGIFMMKKNEEFAIVRLVKRANDYCNHKVEVPLNLLHKSEKEISFFEEKFKKDRNL